MLKKHITYSSTYSDSGSAYILPKMKSPQDESITATKRLYAEKLPRHLETVQVSN